MARKRKYVSIAKGTIWSGDQGFETLNAGVEEVFKCCGPDCCENVYRWVDRTTHEVWVTYFDNGVFVKQTEEDFKNGLEPIPV
jgi:hypothetical protein